MFDDGYKEGTCSIFNTETQEEYYYVHSFPEEYPYKKRRELMGRYKRWTKLVRRINADKIIVEILGYPKGRKIVVYFKEGVPTFLRNYKKKKKKKD